MKIPPEKVPVTPGGKDPAVIVAPVAPPPTVYCIGTMAVFIHIVCVAEPDIRTIVAAGLTTTFTVEVAKQPPGETTVNV